MTFEIILKMEATAENPTLFIRFHVKNVQSKRRMPITMEKAISVASQEESSIWTSINQIVKLHKRNLQ